MAWGFIGLITWWHLKWWLGSSSVWGWLSQTLGKQNWLGKAKLVIIKIKFSTEDRVGGISLCKDIFRAQPVSQHSLSDESKENKSLLIKQLPKHSTFRALFTLTMRQLIACTRNNWPQPKTFLYCFSHYFPKPQHFLLVCHACSKARSTAQTRCISSNIVPQFPQNNCSSNHFSSWSCSDCSSDSPGLHLVCVTRWNLPPGRQSQCMLSSQ